MTCLIKYVFQIKQKIKVYMFLIWLQEKMNQQFYQKDTSCNWKCKFDKKINWDKKWNNYKCWRECKKSKICEKDYTWNLATYNCEDGKYLVSITEGLVIGYDEITEKTKAVPTNFNEEKYTLKYKNVCTCIFINYNKVNDICVYLLSSGKISSKIKKLLPFHDKKKKKRI